MNYADKLRLLADYLDARPLLRDSVEGDWQYPSLRIYADTPSQFGELVAAAGPGEKGSSGGTYGPPTLTFGVCPDDDAYEVVIELYQTADNAVCQKVEKGTKTVRRTFAIPEGAKLTETGWEVEEEVPIVEWECPESFIALREGGTVHER